MIKRFLGWVLLLHLPFLLYAQKVKDPKFGKISPEELSMKVYEKDSSAQAVVLFDISDMDFVFNTKDAFGEVNGFDIRKKTLSAKVQLKRHVRIKILGKQGYNAADILLPVYWQGATGEELRSLKGVTYNQENGTITETKLKDSQVFKQKDGNYTFYKFALPNVREGSVIEFSYELVSDYVDNLQPWEYQGRYPVIRAVCRATIPYAFVYKFRKQGNHPFAVQEVKEIQANAGMEAMRATDGVWEAHDVPAMKSEPLMAPLRTQLGRMDFQLQYVEWDKGLHQSFAERWDVVEEKMLKESEYFGAYFKGHQELYLAAQQIMAVSTDTIERVSKSAALIRERVQWNGNRGMFASDHIDTVLKKGSGNSTAQNLLLLAILRAMGIPSWPLLVPNRDDRPLDPTFADPNVVTDALVLIRLGGGEQPVKYMVVDASDAMLPIGMVPPRCQSGYGWICQGEDIVPWYKLETDQPSNVKVQVSLKIADDGNLSGQVTQQLEGYSAYRIRKEGKITEELVDRMLEPNIGQVSGLQVTHEQDVQKPLHLNYQVAIEPREKILLTDKTLDLQPLLAYMEDLDIFKLPKYEYPVDLESPIHYHYGLTFELPEGYTLNAAPGPISMSLPDKSARLVYRLGQSDNMLVVSWQLQFNKARYELQEYTALREFAIRVLAKLQEMVSLQKVGQ